MPIVTGPSKNRSGRRNDPIDFPLPPAGDSLQILLKNVVEQGRLAATGTATELVEIPEDAFAAAQATFRNEGTEGNWLISFAGGTPTSTDYSIKLGPGESLGEAYTEENPPLGSIKAKHDDPGAGGAGVLAWYVGWNDGTSPLVGPTGPQGEIGETGQDGGFKFQFNTGTSGDPGSGKFLFNNATFASATVFHVSETDANANALAALLTEIDNSTSTNKTLVIATKQGGSAYFSFFITAALTDAGAYDTFAITPIASSGSIANNDVFHIGFYIAGNKGDTGATGATGETGATGTGGSKDNCGFRLTLAPGNPAYYPQPATPSSTDTGAETCTFAADHGWESGTIVTPSATGGGLTAGTRYFLNKSSATVVSFHTTVADALAATNKVNLTASITAQIIPLGISNTTMYFSPWLSNEISLYDGANWGNHTSAEVSLALGTLTADKNYDWFAYDVSGTLTLETVAWTSNTARATALVKQDGIWVKSGSLTKRYIGTMRTNTTTTTIMEDYSHKSATSVKLFLWNHCNRLRRPFFRWEETDNWTQTNGAFRQARSSANNQIEVVVGLMEEEIQLEVGMLAQGSSTGLVIGLSFGEDSTTVPDIRAVKMILVTGSSAIEYNPEAHLRKIVPLGYHKYIWLEYGNTTTTWYSDDNSIRRTGVTGAIRT